MQQDINKKRGNLILENGRKLTLTGITDVENFSCEKIILTTNEGILTVTGSEMHVKKLSAESGDAIIEGQIDGCVYSKQHGSGEGFLKRVLK